MPGNPGRRPIGALKATPSGAWKGTLYPKDRTDQISVVLDCSHLNKPGSPPKFWNVYNPDTGDQIGFLSLARKHPRLDPATGQMVTRTTDHWNGVILDISVSASIPAEALDPDGNPRMVVKQRLGVPVIPFKPMAKR